MAKTIFEEMGGTYVRQGDYLLPCLSLLAKKENKPVGVWGHRHLRYLKQHRKVLYTNLLTSCKLNSYLANIDAQAEDMFLRLVEQMAEQAISDIAMIDAGKVVPSRTVFPVTLVERGTT